ncbi:MAG: lipoate--protein ligase [Lachnospiraceae bacterium]|nr:lipoate--protein ligase [Lachnospiraceae bacterium]
MIQKIQYVVTKETNPYKNIALEEYLLKNTKPGSCVLYLWQNRHTIVIGRNQNCWKECKVTKLEGDGGFLARRLSGGGAVFHDLGNLNFTFLVPEEDYDVDRQLKVIVEACRFLGICAEKTGRNDITVEGRKFSGNAFYKTEKKCYHHGTLLLRVDMENLSQYLNVSTDKLKAKGVSSVKSRVTNLCEYCPDITVELMTEKLIEAFEKVYGLKAEEIPIDSLPKKELEERTQFFGSKEWKYGNHLPFTFSCSKRFEWGDIDLQLQVEKGNIVDVKIYSDAMEETFLLKWMDALKKIPFRQQDMIEKLENLALENEVQKQMIKDMIALLKEQEL